MTEKFPLFYSSNAPEGGIKVNSGLRGSENLDSRVPMNPIAKVLRNRNVSLNINWSSVCSMFESLYARSFTASKKAHFDSLPDDWSADDKMVDGARSRWCLPLVLDAILTILENDRFDLSHRRSFNQGRVLRDCILKEVQDHYPLIYSELAKQAEKKPKRLVTTSNYCLQNHLQAQSLNDYGDCESSALMSSELVEFSTRTIAGSSHSEISANHCLSPQEILHEYGKASSVQLIGSFKGWKTVEDLKTLLLPLDLTLKSKKKYISIVTALLNHPLICFYHKDIIQLLKIVVFKAIFVFPFPAQHLLTSDALLPDTSSGRASNCSGTNSEEKIDKVETSLNPELNLQSLDGSTSKLDEITPTAVTSPTLKRKNEEEVTSSHRTEGVSSVQKKRKINLLEYLDYEKLSKLEYADVLDILNCAQKSSEDEITSPSNSFIPSVPVMNHDLTTLQSIYYWFEKHSQLPICELHHLPPQLNLSSTFLSPTPLPTVSNDFSTNNGFQANYMMQYTILENMIQQLCALNNSHNHMVNSATMDSSSTFNQNFSFLSQSHISKQNSINFGESGSNASQFCSVSDLLRQSPPFFPSMINDKNV